MSKDSFIFLPDISGFTRFVHTTESEHSQHIIAELLEVLIDNQTLGLTLAEIEGDAIFYFKNESVPAPEELFEQVRRLFLAFHDHLQQYEVDRICDCGACSTASQLTLKFIAHAGPLEFIQIKKDRKPYGATVIAAHRLMKNEVPSDEYLLLSEGVLKNWDQRLPELADLVAVEGQSEYDLGVVKYQHFELEPLRKYIKEYDPTKAAITTAAIVRETVEIAQPVTPLFEYISNFKYRLEWSKGLQQLDYPEERVNRAGMKHFCVINDRRIELETIVSGNLGDKLVYGERTTDFPLAKELNSYFILEPQGESTQLTIEVHPVFPPIVGVFLRPLLKRVMKKSVQEIAKSIKQAVAEKPTKLLSTVPAKP